MSSRALRHIKSKGVVADSDSAPDDDVEDGDLLVCPPRKTFNAFAALGGDDDIDEVDDDDLDSTAPSLSPAKASTNKKKKKKKKKNSSGSPSPNCKQSSAAEGVTSVDGAEEVERCVREVNSILGISSTIGAASSATAASLPSLDTRGILCIDHRLLNADNEMKRIFGAKVVRTEKRTGGRRDRRSARKAGIVNPRDNWPTFGRSGLSMELVNHEGSYYYFAFEHNELYRQTQVSFWQSVETMNPDAIAAVLRQHPYHVDSLLQLAEICKMNEDRRAAAELIERSIYALEGGFHTLFNVATACNRLDFKKAENRPFFLALFRHLAMVGLRGCYRTSLEFCKLLLSLEPDTDPLGILLVLDFYALRCGEYSFLIRLSHEWEAHHHLSKLPNMAYSCALARFHDSGASGSDAVNEGQLAMADKALQTALLQFPMVLVPLLDCCGVVMDTVTSHTFFASASVTCPDPLERVCRLYIERTHSVWKEPEVLTWLEANAGKVLSMVEAGDRRVGDFQRERARLYKKTPRNVLRHVIVSDLPNVSAFLPPDVASDSIMMYDPLPPTDSYSSYKRPERRTMAEASNASFLSLFLQAMSPNFDPNAPAEEEVGAPQARAPINAAGLAGMAQMVTQAARDGHTRVANALQQLMNTLEIDDGPAPGEAVPQINAEDGDAQAGAGHEGFADGDFLPDDVWDEEFD